MGGRSWKRKSGYDRWANNHDQQRCSGDAAARAGEEDLCYGHDGNEHGGVVLNEG